MVAEAARASKDKALPVSRSIRLMHIPLEQLPLGNMVNSKAKQLQGPFLGPLSSLTVDLFSVLSDPMIHPPPRK